MDSPKWPDRPRARIPTPESDSTGRAPRSSREEVVNLLREATFGDYEVLEELGRGGMATVYLARDLKLDRLVAIKVLAPQLFLLDATLVERFKREARTAGRLSSPHIIPIHAVKQTEKVIFIVMKYVQGRSLESVIRELGRLPVKMVHAILAQVGAALNHAHRQGVIHRDIKPANIMLDDEGYAVVTDFGVAKVHDLLGLSGSGLRLGTPYYMSPEQSSGGPVTAAADQYGLGITLYEMLTGTVPFRGSTVEEVVEGHIHEVPAPIRPIRPDCPRALANGILRMLAKRPEDRWPDLQSAVEACAGAPIGKDDPIRAEMAALSQTGERIPTPGVPLESARAIPREAAIEEPLPDPAAYGRLDWKVVALLVGILVILLVSLFL